ncbi:MAG: thiosulfate oxidation carrier complex protein SoxZ [Pseudomonadota bacterium]
MKTKLRAKLVGNTVEAMVLINHPMESGFKKPFSFERPARCHHITEIKAIHNGHIVFAAHWGGPIARNPYLSFRFKDAKRGDTLTLHWIDNGGAIEETRTVIS